MRHLSFALAWKTSLAMPVATISMSFLGHSGSASSAGGGCSCSRAFAVNAALPTWMSLAPPGSISPCRSNAPSITAYW